MNIVIDSSVIIAIIGNEPEKNALIQLSKGARLIAPHSIHWEIGNAFSAMFKRKRLTLEKAIKAIEIYKKIPIRFEDIELDTALQIAERLGIYAYDAYLITCALKYDSLLLSLDRKLINFARQENVRILEIIL